MQQDMSQLIVEVMAGIIVLFLTGCGTVLWWGINRIIQTQEVGVERLDHIDVRLTDIDGKLNGVEIWQASHEKSDDERHAAAEKIQSGIWAELGQIRKDFTNLRRR